MVQDGPPTSPGGGGERQVDEDVDEDGDGGDVSTGADNEKWFVIISIVVGCGIMTLVLLCVVRKVTNQEAWEGYGVLFDHVCMNAVWANCYLKIYRLSEAVTAA